MYQALITELGTFLEPMNIIASLDSNLGEQKSNC